MRYTVGWSASAQNELAEVWLEAADRNAVAEASNEIDEFLAVSPNDPRCEIVAGGGILIIGPLGVQYRIRERDRFVAVVNVWIVTSED